METYSWGRILEFRTVCSRAFLRHLETEPAGGRKPNVRLLFFSLRRSTSFPVQTLAQQTNFRDFSAIFYYRKENDTLQNLCFLTDLWHLNVFIFTLQSNSSVSEHLWKCLFRSFNVGAFSKTMVPSFFKLCVIVTLHEHYKCPSLSVTFDLYWRSQGQQKNLVMQYSSMWVVWAFALLVMNRSISQSINQKPVSARKVSFQSPESQISRSTDRQTHTQTKT